MGHKEGQPHLMNWAVPATHLHGDQQGLADAQRSLGYLQSEAPNKV